MATKPKVYKFPKSMGLCADKLFTLREQRAKIQKMVDEIEAEEKALKAYIIDTLPKSQASGAAGKLCRVTVVKKEVPTFTNKNLFLKHLAKSGEFDLISMRLSNTAVQERWDSKKKIPGVGIFEAITVSVNKV